MLKYYVYRTVLEIFLKLDIVKLLDVICNVN